MGKTLFKMNYDSANIFAENVQLFDKLKLRFYWA